MFTPRVFFPLFTMVCRKYAFVLGRAADMTCIMAAFPERSVTGIDVHQVKADLRCPCICKRAGKQKAGQYIFKYFLH
jgi:hypothetical protein